METACRGGIDPGKKGFVVLIVGDGKHESFPIPTIKGKVYDNQAVKLLFSGFAGKYKDLHFVLEGVNSDPKWGAVTNWDLGNCLGMLEQVLTDFEIPFTKVNPRLWQKEMWQGIKVIKKPSSTGKTMVNDTKAMSEVAVKRLFPHVDFNITAIGGKSKNFNDNFGDAMLMAEYCRRKF